MRRDFTISEETSKALHSQLGLIRQIVTRIDNAVATQAEYQSCCCGSWDCRAKEPYPSAHRNIVETSQPSSGGADSFELLPSFLPENYTVDQRLPPNTITIVSSHEKAATSESVTNIYRVLFLKSSRECHRLCISLCFHRSFKDWRAIRIGGKNDHQTIIRVTEGARMPHLLLGQVKRHLVDQENLSEGHITFDVAAETNVSLSYSRVTQAVTADLPGCLGSTVHILNTLNDMGCPRYAEQEVIAVQMIIPPYRFVSCFRGRLVSEIKLTESMLDLELLYTIKALHLLRGRSGFATLIGLVVDSTGTQLKSYITDLEEPYRWFRQVKSVQGLPWHRRENWAKQLIQALCDIHARGLVLGGSITSPNPRVIESTDHIRIQYFEPRWVVGIKVNCNYPPEFRYLKTISAMDIGSEAPYTTSKADLFALGQQLWVLAEDSPSKHINPLCIRNRCDGKSEACSHDDPIELPDLGDNVPQYYKDIVATCRAEKPEDRRPAWELLKWFPNKQLHLSVRSQKPMTLDLPDIPVIDPLNFNLESFKRCNICGMDPISLDFFHCNVCDNGNFDFCPRCFGQGRHCFNNQHLVTKVKIVGIEMEAQGYFGSVGNTGQREIIDLELDRIPNLSNGAKGNEE